jgi:competence protein ComEC
MGDASLTDDTFIARYRKIGLSHLCVVSGSNISFVLCCIVLCCFFLPFRLRIITATLCGIGYVYAVGGDAPVLRASIMGSIGLISLIFGSTKTDPLRILVLAALLLCLYSPLSIVYDIGFHLSFLATIGILVSNTLSRGRGIFIGLYSGSIFAAIWTLPLSIGLF